MNTNFDFKIPKLHLHRKGWTQLALDYNSLVISWQAIVQLASAEKKPTTEQGNLFNI
ncbi:hypothetical protein [Pseudanabaena minima]|uniref:hypothetical protein n=1 Tax=Pseudanabaena minima TaxID=890415 RepID=UPI003DA94CF6